MKSYKLLSDNKTDDAVEEAPSIECYVMMMTVFHPQEYTSYHNLSTIFFKYVLRLTQTIYFYAQTKNSKLKFSKIFEFNKKKVNS